MENKPNFNSQFLMTHEDWLKGIDLLNWHRYYMIIKTVLHIKPKTILEIGAGNEIIKNALLKFVKNYKVMDINPKLKPDILSDVRRFRPELKGKFDCIICADVLEHMPFEDLNLNLTNIYNYLISGGRAIITVPHRETRLMLVTPFSRERSLIIPLPFIHTLKGYWKILKDYICKRIDLDPHHRWEIGRMGITIADVGKKIRKSGFYIEKFQKLLYVDFWILRK